MTTLSTMAMPCSYRLLNGCFWPLHPPTPSSVMDRQAPSQLPGAHGAGAQPQSATEAAASDGSARPSRSRRPAATRLVRSTQPFVMPPAVAAPSAGPATAAATAAGPLPAPALVGQADAAVPIVVSNSPERIVSHAATTFPRLPTPMPTTGSPMNVVDGSETRPRPAAAGVATTLTVGTAKVKAEENHDRGEETVLHVDNAAPANPVAPAAGPAASAPGPPAELDEILVVDEPGHGQSVQSVGPHRDQEARPPGAGDAPGRDRGRKRSSSSSSVAAKRNRTPGGRAIFHSDIAMDVTDAATSMAAKGLSPLAESHGGKGSRQVAASADGEEVLEVVADDPPASLPTPSATSTTQSGASNSARRAGRGAFAKSAASGRKPIPGAASPEVDLDLPVVVRDGSDTPMTTARGRANRRVFGRS